jgi:two-component system response regulator VicR
MQAMTVLVVEDDAEITEFVSIALEIGWPGVKVISVHHGSGVAELVEVECPDVVVLDLNLPDTSGFEVLKAIRRVSNIPVIIITVRDSEADIVKGLEWGADEYVVKPFGQMELVARVRAVLRSRQYSGAAQMPIVHGPVRFDPVTDELVCASYKIQLTRSESLVFYSLIRNAGHVVTYGELAEAMWGIDYPRSVDTLRVYVRRLRAKLAKDTEHKVLIESRPGRGYLLQVRTDTTS